MDLKGNGSVAWIAEDPGHNPPYSQVDSDGVKGPMVLDEGPEIDPNSLSLEDSALSWINAGSPRSATLR
jgi:hypothetical protein